MQKMNTHSVLHEVHLSSFNNGLNKFALPKASLYRVRRFTCRSFLSGESQQSHVHCTRRNLLLGISFLSASVPLFIDNGNRALADVRIALSNIQTTEVPCPEGQTTVTGGTSFEATCFRVTGDAVNPSNQTVYNADVFGRVFDAQGEPALDAAENLRIDTISEIPPGKSKVTFQITVNSAQAKLGPLELKNFKATGYLGKVNNRQGSGRLDDIDFSELDDIP